MESGSNEVLDLSILKTGIAPGLSQNVGGGFYEAASVCLYKCDHEASRTRLKVTGDETGTFRIAWTLPTEQVTSTHFDLQDATEDGACGIAISLMWHLRGVFVLRKTYKGKGQDRGFDYWLGEAGSEKRLPCSDGDVRMEVSGILDGTQSDFDRRLEQKADQVATSATGVPGIAVVVMFNRPEAGVRDL